jgi:hypothetical protein
MMLPIPGTLSLDHLKENLAALEIELTDAGQPLGKAYLNRLIKDAKGPESPYRGRLLKASWGGHGVQLEILRDPTETRERIVLPSAIWESLDINVHQMVAKMKAFEAAGLGSNRGVLLAGAPGTGKTAACRVLAQEALGSVTAVFVDSIVAESLLPQLYTTISDMAPALLFLEDLDLIVGSRRNRSVRRSLLNFLTVLDGLMTQHHDVITVATTNDPEAVDAAVRRAARFDRVVTFPLPDERDRQRILEVYLRSFDHQVDTREVAGVTAGKTGADLREYIRTACSASRPHWARMTSWPSFKTRPGRVPLPTDPLAQDRRTVTDGPQRCIDQHRK